MASHDIDDLIDALTAWAASRPEIKAIALVGSYARQEATKDSDVDLVVITTNPDQYLNDTRWLLQFGKLLHYEIEDYGLVKSVRTWYADKAVIEYGITTAQWVAPPLDAGTRKVVSDGMKVLFERESILSITRDSCNGQDLAKMNSRADILALLHGKRINRLPVFGVLPSLTAAGIKKTGARYGELHDDAEKMAKAAASTFELYRFESAVVPFDLCVEAEALGCQVDFQKDVDAFLAPTISNPIENLPQVLDPAGRLGRIPIIAEAIRRLKKRLGDQVAIGAWVPGPFTLAWQLFGADAWLSQVGAQDVAPILQRLAGWLPDVANCYHEAGADFITVHEMGGSPQIIGPKKFSSLVKPALQNLFAQLPAPSILSVCGDTNAVVHDLAECGASAINVDHRNDLACTRQILGPDAILLGNFDPVGVLSHGAIEDVRRSVKEIVQASASAIVPGCDLYPDIPDENMRALVESVKKIWA